MHMPMMNTKNNKYNNKMKYLDKLYSEAFEEGVNYALEKMYASVTNYDRYNTLRDMNDADILAQEKKKNPYSPWKATGNTLAATAAGTGLGAAVGAATGMFRKGGSIGRGAGKGALIGGIASSLISSGIEGRKVRKGQEEANEYNRRLSDAQRLAARRERVDWYKNQRGRTDYTY